MTDLWGYPVALPPGPALQAWNAMQLGFLAHKQRTAGDLAQVLEAAPDFAAAQAARGLFLLLLGRSELRPAAAEAHAAAMAAGAADDPRARRLAAALGRWLGGGHLAAIAEVEALLAAFPRDAFAMKLDHAMRFMAGDLAGMRRQVGRLDPHYGDDHPARGYFLGCRAFALEEAGDYAEARAAGEAGLSLAPDDAWGLHAVAHVHDMTGDAEGGLRWLEGREAAWAECNNFRYHVWWHKALMHLDRGDGAAALALYDAEIRRDRTDDYRDISNATSLLMRLELDGHPVGDRWDELAAFAAARTDDGALIFADLHYLLGLVGAGGRKPAERRLIARIRADAGRDAHDQDRVARYPGLAAAEGLAAFGEGDYGNAFKRLVEARDAMTTVGGSHAQRDVFERITIDAGLRAGHLAAAEALLDDRRRRRGGAEDGYEAARRALISDLRVAVAAAE